MIGDIGRRSSRMKKKPDVYNPVYKDVSYAESSNSDDRQEEVVSRKKRKSVINLDLRQHPQPTHRAWMVRNIRSASLKQLGSFSTKFQLL